MRGPPGDVIGHPPALAVGHVGQGDQRRGMGDGVGLLDRVAHRVDVGIAGLVHRVDGQAAARAEVETGCRGQLDIGPDADGADHQVGGKDSAVGEGDRVGPDRFDGHAGLDGDAMGHQLVGDQDRHLRIERRQHLGGGFHDGDREALGDEVLGHLQADEPGADHHRRLRRGAHIGGQDGGVLHRPQGPDPFVAGDRRAHRCGAHAQHQLVVADAQSRLPSPSSGP